MNFIFPDPLGHLGRGQPQPPEIGNWLNILKTIEIPIPNPYIFMFLMLLYRQCLQYTRYGPWGQPHPPETGNC
jgi:hypothetical protein